MDINERDGMENGEKPESVGTLYIARLDSPNDLECKMYSVLLWASHPNNENDDCITGTDFLSLREALACAANIADTFFLSSVAETQYIEVDGPNHYSIRKNPNYVARKDNGDDWRNEIARQAGMMGGCDAYNDAMGY